MWSWEPCVGLAACRVKEDLNIVSAPGNQTHIIKLLCSAPRGGGGGGGGTHYDDLYGEALPERGTFFKLQVYERGGVSLGDVYKRVGKSVIWICKRAQKKRANRWILWL